MPKLYHYTNEAGMSGILQSGSLRPSLKALNPKDARYGDGQYFSDIVPGTKTQAQLSQAFLRNRFQGRRFSNFVEIEAIGLPVVQGRAGVYVIRNDGPLDISTRLLKSGRAGQ